MDPGTVGAVLSALGAGVILQQVVKWLLNRGTVRIEQAYQIREELRKEITRKTEQLNEMNRRVDLLEEELEKAVKERQAATLALERYKLAVYRELLDAGVDKRILTNVLTMTWTQENP